MDGNEHRGVWPLGPHAVRNLPLALLARAVSTAFWAHPVRSFEGSQA